MADKATTEEAATGSAQVIEELSPDSAAMYKQLYGTGETSVAAATAHSQALYSKLRGANTPELLDTAMEEHRQQSQEDQSILDSLEDKFKGIRVYGLPSSPLTAVSKQGGDGAGAEEEEAAKVAVQVEDLALASEGATAGEDEARAEAEEVQAEDTGVASKTEEAASGDKHKEDKTKLQTGIAVLNGKQNWAPSKLAPTLRDLGLPLTIDFNFIKPVLVGLLPYEQANADEWSKVGGSCTLDVCEGFSITFAHSGARHQARAQIFPEVGPNGASHVAQWFEALRNIPESDTAGMEEVTKTYLRKPEVRGGTKKT